MEAAMSLLALLSLAVTVLLCAALPARGQELPEGKGKEIVAASCNSCHPFQARLGAGYTAEGWRTVMRMMTNHGVVVPADQLATVTEYLTKNFPEKSKPAGAVIPGPAKVAIKEWQVLAPRARPPDPLAPRERSRWYTGQKRNILGRVDPETANIKGDSPQTPHTAPTAPRHRKAR